jgi:hypothetical protein
MFLPWVAVFFLVLRSGQFVASDPMDFDIHLSVPCKEVTPKDLKERNPELRIVEAMFRISANIDVKEEAIDYISYDLDFPEEVGIADFLPKTELGSEIAGPINYSDNRTRKSFIQVAIEGKASARYLVSGSISGKIGTKAEEGIASGVQIQLLPPKQVVLAAGTRSRGKVLCFKLKPFNQITLEGQREFACLLTVPVTWKGGCVIFRGLGRIKGEESEVVREMKVGLYPDWEPKAKAKVEEEAKAFPGRKESVKRKLAKSFTGVWEGIFLTQDSLEGRMTGSISEKGEFSGNTYLEGDKIHGTFKGRINEGKATFDLVDPAGEFVGEGILALDKEGRLVGTLEMKDKEGKVVGSFKVQLLRK